VAILTRDLYRSANGDRWPLAHDTDVGRVFIRHEPNPSSGGRTSDTDIGAFLATGGHGPEKQELLRLIGTLIEQPAGSSSDALRSQGGGSGS